MHKINHIIIVETDTEFVSRFESKIESEGISDKYKILVCIPKTTLAHNDMVDKCVKNIINIISDTDNVIGVFIDIVIMHSNPTDNIGTEIARELRKSCPLLPIFNISSKFGKDPEENDIFSAATLEDIDGVFVKHYLEGDYFSAKRLKNIFIKAKEKRNTRYIGLRSMEDSQIPESLRNNYQFEGIDPRVKNQIIQIGESKFWNLIDRIFPNTKGLVTYMQQGRSGAYVFRVKNKFFEIDTSATLPKEWILKISKDRSQLDEEIRNYKSLIKSKVKRDYFPKLLTQDAVGYGDIFGIALELEENTDSLYEKFRYLKVEDYDVLRNDLVEYLVGLYGDASNNIVRVWDKSYRISHIGVTKMMSFFEEYSYIFTGDLNIKTDIIKKFINEQIGLGNKITKYECHIDTRNIHGDFNSKNILLGNNNRMYVIDYSSRQQDHVVKDLAKLERDIVFRINDAYKSEYYDWNRIAIWQEFKKINEVGHIFENNYSSKKDDIEKCVVFIYMIRDVLKTICPKVGEIEYLMALLYYSLISLIHPDISIQKKVFAINYVVDIINQLNERV